jgi:indolepyruvate ferredoxin oxidoreductase, beta subunit
MNAHSPITYDKPLSVAILAMGGQGGGVLAQWIVEVAEANGWYAQSTSVPGVAQRTGATLYYIEMLPPRGDVAPVLALMPTPGDVDVVIAAELMEAGRSILRGLATPEKTVLITSTHRAYAVSEKEKPGEAIGDPRAVNAAADVAAKRIISFDMDRVARAHGTVVSSPILGALAGAGVLPFVRGTFEQVIGDKGKGVAASLKGFDAGFALASANELPEVRIKNEVVSAIIPETLGSAQLDAQLTRLRALPLSAQSLALAGFKRVIDFQDIRYGVEYLDRLDALKALDEKAGGGAKDYAFLTAAAKHLANAMAYDDVIGVADLKTRSTRFSRIAKEMKASGNEPIYFTEFMHPRAEELVSLLPRRLGSWISARPSLMTRIDRIFNRGRHLQTAKLGGFLQLYALSGLRRFRRRLLRHARETAHVDAWLTLATHHLAKNYDLARGIISTRRLIKGYSDTHARGISKFDRVLSAVPLLAAREDAGEWMDRLISAALKDEDGTVLDGALQTLKSL